MLNKKLKIYLYICVTIFFVLLAVVLFYSFGYKYDTEERKTIQTGAIIIKSVPRDIDIYINDNLFENNNALNTLLTGYVKVENLNSGKYNIKIKKDGYFNWEKNVNINGGYITDLKNIVLLKNSYEKNILLDNITADLNEKNIWANNGKNKVVYMNKNNLNLFDINSKTKNDEIKIIANFGNTPFNKNGDDTDFHLDDIIWSNDDTKIIAKISENNSPFWYLIDLGNKNEISDVSFIFNEISEVKNKYSFDFNKSLFYLKNDALYEFDYEKLVSKRMLRDLSGFLVHGDYLYYFKKDGCVLYVSNLDNLSETKVVSIMPDNFNTKSPVRIIRSSNNAYLILSLSGELYFISKTNGTTLINSRVKNAYFTNHNERIIYYNNHEIWIYYIKEKLSQPPKKEFENELITRYSDEISSISLYIDEEHLFYKEGNAFKFIEFDNRDKVNVFGVLELENNDVLYSRDNNSVYYVEDGKLIWIDLDEE
ncbi:hypothetical protein KAI56_04485 [Candidatus Parcubacteria bacterium]|nr:hypothetical protein [Candidatus Parcubacteria bacterium]